MIKENNNQVRYCLICQSWMGAKVHRHVLWPLKQFYIIFWHHKMRPSLKFCIFLPSGTRSLHLCVDTGPFLYLSLPPPNVFTSTIPTNHGIFSSLRANRTTQRWKTFCKTLSITEGSTTMNTSTATMATIMATSSMMQTGTLTVTTARTLRRTWGHPWRVGRSRTQVQTPVYRRAEVWSLTCRPLSVPQGPRVPGVDLTPTATMR